MTDYKDLESRLRNTAGYSDHWLVKDLRIEAAAAIRELLVLVEMLPITHDRVRIVPGRNDCWAWATGRR